MDSIRTLLIRIASFFRREHLDAALDEELRAHIELAIEENMKLGMSKKQARTAALRSFGGMTQAKEAYRTQRGLPWLESLAQDLDFAMRTLRKSSGFTAVSILTLALGIGGNTAMFSIVNGVLLNPLPFPHPDQLVMLHESKPNFPTGSISYPNFLDWQSNNHSFSAMAVSRRSSFSLTGRGDAEQVQAEFISPDYFSILGIHPIFGRLLNSADNEPGATPAVLVGESLWRQKFNADPNVIGQSVMLDGKDFFIAGIIPASFHLGIRQQEIYIPIRQWGHPLLLQRGAGLGIHGIARLKPGVTLEQARADMDRVSRNLAAVYPDADRGVGASIVPLKQELVGDSQNFLLILLGAVAFVLLIACANVASLLLARSTARSHEFAVRIALGASRSRIIRQLLTENLLLAITAGAMSLIPAIWGMRAVIRVLPAAVARAQEIGFDLRVFLFAAVVSVVTAILFGLIPALRISETDPQSALRQNTRGASGTNHRVLSAFVTAEIAIALILLVGAGLMLRSLGRLWNVDPGFNPRNVLTFNLSLPPSMSSLSADATRAEIRALNQRFAAVPGVTAVSQTWGAVPMDGEDDQLFWIDGQPKPKNQNDMNWVIDYIVDPDYFRIMQIPLHRGRLLTAQDDEHAPLAVVVDEVFAHKFFPGQDPIGKQIHLVNNSDRLAQIVGVVGHVKQWGLDSDDAQPLRAEYYLPCMQMPDSWVSGTTGTNMIVRYNGSLAAALASIRSVNRQMSQEQVLFGEQTMESIPSRSMASRRFAMMLLGAFAVLALLLSCIGIYGVTAYLVSRRTQEIGVRMALGAQRDDVLRLILWRGAKLALLGATTGIACALGLTQLMRSLLFDTTTYDPLTLACVSVLLLLVSLAACVIPARRAASIDPMRALRTE